MSDPRDQPYLHNLVTVLRAPMVALGGRDGQLRAAGVQGIYAYDRRLLSSMVVAVQGATLEPLGASVVEASSLHSTSVLRGIGDRQPDPTVFMHRCREVAADSVVETLRSSSRAQQPVELVVVVGLGADLADLAAVRQGDSYTALPPTVVGSRVTWSVPEAQTTVTMRPEPTGASADGEGATLSWRLVLAPGEAVEIELTTTGTVPPPPFEAAAAALWTGVQVQADDRRVESLTLTGLADLRALLLQDGTDLFAAAGSPWFFTLFGRDSLWTARLLLPFGTDLAMGTLRTLARRQGQRDDPAIEEQPGKILHEVRRSGLHVGDLSLPPVYFGSVDATPLWIALLVDAWRWGADRGEIEALLPAAEAALAWLRRQVSEDPLGFVRYFDSTGSGLSNQGWKDSGDSVQWADGRLAEGSIALSEVQAYAYEAAMGAAELLTTFGRPGAAAWRSWAGELQDRFRAHFWVKDDLGAYPAIALDGQGEAVDGVASNMAHLLGTGLLTADESSLIAVRLAGADLDSGYGLRTLTDRSPRFSPLSYHGGAVWPHDTAIAARGLLLAGHDSVAAALLSESWSSAR